MHNFYIVLSIFNILLFFSFSKISKLINIYDFPDGKRKLHRSKVSLLGGFIIYLNLILFFGYSSLFQFTDNNFFFMKIISNFSFFYSFLVTSTLLFIIGILDDKFDINAYKKFILFSIIILFALIIDDSLIINEIELSFLNTIIVLGKISIPFTIICFLLFINAMNMFDGINLQIGFYSIILLFYFLSKGLDINLFITLIFSLIIFLKLNFSNRTFMGDSGSILIAYIIGYVAIKYYNNDIIVYADEIFILMLVPGLDLLRVSITRILSRKSIFSADRIHIHHLLQAHFNNFQSFLIIQVMIIIPLLFSMFFLKIIDSIFIGILIYFIVIYKTYKNNRIYE